mmetsp:Transcript_18806/g.24578  ORF Transcript_18806/g.24578 Transcript_18806/m.24578 type:complete len:92 (+) Transcript_18806:1293-1568(+)
MQNRNPAMMLKTLSKEQQNKSNSSQSSNVLFVANLKTVNGQRVISCHFQSSMLVILTTTFSMQVNGIAIISLFPVFLLLILSSAVQHFWSL